MSTKEVIDLLKSQGNEKNKEGMKKFGINDKGTLGVSIPNIRALAKRIGKDHELALKLWQSGIHEARILAAYIDTVETLSEDQLNLWVKDFNSWDICDQVIGNLFDKYKYANKKAIEWSKRDEEFVKRAGFVLMACLAVHDKRAKDSDFYVFFDLIKKESIDERNFVKKSVNWALRQIGKRNENLRKVALKSAYEIKEINSKSAKWIANDAIRELLKKNFKD